MKFEYQRRLGEGVTWFFSEPSFLASEFGWIRSLEYRRM